jgi:chorismate lyase
MEGELLDLLSPAWRIMLLSDGSVTRHLRLLCPKLDCTALELVAQGPIGTFAGAGGAAAMPADVERIEGDLVQREVLLRIRGPERDDSDLPGWSDRGGSALTATPLTAAADGTVPAVYAASWWSSDTFAEFMSDSKSPMWSNLRSGNVELYREVRRVYQGDNKALEEVFGTTGPFWGRHYIFWHAGKVLTVVYEVFNPRLENKLGPAKPP